MRYISLDIETAFRCGRQHGKTTLYSELLDSDRVCLIMTEYTPEGVTQKVEACFIISMDEMTETEVIPALKIDKRPYFRRFENKRMKHGNNKD